MKHILEESLLDHGYLHTLPLKKDRPVFAHALCHYFDIIVDKKESEHESSAWQAFYGEFSAENKTTLVDDTGFGEQHEFVENDEKRRFLIQDFITTEGNYIKNMDVFIKTIVNPLRTRSKGRKSSVILGAYECHQVFMNIEEIHKMNTSFYSDLHQHNRLPQNRCFIGMLFNRHLSDFKYYRKFLLGVENARLFHTKELKNNMAYQSFIDRTMVDAGYTVYDYLLLPGQRLGHYKMFLQELIKHTSNTDPDFDYLVESLSKTEDAASLHDDYHTNLIQVFQNMLQSIQNCPASLISQQRSLLYHIDATEYELHSQKAIGPVAIFLFTDKIMVVKRPSYESNGLDLCGMDQKPGNQGSACFVIRKDEQQQAKRLERKLKFRGWIGLNDAEIYKGPHGLLSSFILVTTNTGGGSPEVDQGLENYFQEQRAHIFSLASPFFDPTNTSSPSLSPMQSTINESSSSLSSSSISFLSHLESQQAQLAAKRMDFIDCFGKHKMKLKINDMPMTYCFWYDHHFYATVHDSAYYHLNPSKNDIALLYTSRPLSDIGYILGAISVSAPKTLIIISPLDDHNYSFFIQSQLIGQNSDNQNDDVLLEIPINEATEFKQNLLTNLILCGQDLATIMIRTPSPTPSPQSSTKSVRDTIRQMNKRKSISTINKLLTGSVQVTGNLVKSSVSTRTSPIQMQQQWRKSASHYSETSNDIRDQQQQRTLNNGTPRRSTPTDPTERVTPSSSFLSYRALTVNQQPSMTLNQPNYLPKRYSSSSMQPGLGREVDGTDSLYKPSIHPSQTMSYDIKHSSKPINENEGSIEDRVNSLCVALAQEMDSSMNGRLQANKSTPSHYYTSPGADSIRSIPPRVDSTGSTTIARKPPQTSSTLDISGDKLVTLKDQQKQQDSSYHQSYTTSFPPNTSPVSLVSVSTTSFNASPGSTTLEFLVAEMELMKSDFNKRLSQIIDDYEQTGSVVQKLTRDLRMKEEELSGLRVKYDNSVKENELLYEAFNSEIDHLFMLTTHRDDPSRDTTPAINPAATEEQNPSSTTTPTLEAQWRRKLEMTIKERNQWHQTACQLARELQDVTLYFDQSVEDDNDSGLDSGPRKQQQQPASPPPAPNLLNVTSSVSSPMTVRSSR